MCIQSPDDDRWSIASGIGIGGGRRRSPFDKTRVLPQVHLRGEPVTWHWSIPIMSESARRHRVRVLQYTMYTYVYVDIQNVLSFTVQAKSKRFFFMDFGVCHIWYYGYSRSAETCSLQTKILSFLSWKPFDLKYLIGPRRVFKHS